MIKYHLDTNRYKVYKEFLTVEDLNIVAERSKFSFSTVNGIVNRKTKINSRNEIIIDHLDILVHDKITNIEKKIYDFKKLGKQC